MMTAKHTLKDLVNVVALQSGASIEKPNITEYDGENLVWRLQAERAVEEKGYVHLEQPKIDWYSKQKDVMFLSAAQGQYHQQDKIMLFQGEVVILFQGWELRSASAAFDERKDSLLVETHFVLERKGMVMTGKNVAFSKTEGNIKAWGSVQMLIEQEQ